MFICYRVSLLLCNSGFLRSKALEAYPEQAMDDEQSSTEEHVEEKPDIDDLQAQIRGEAKAKSDIPVEVAFEDNTVDEELPAYEKSLNDKNVDISNTQLDDSGTGVKETENTSQDSDFNISNEIPHYGKMRRALNGDNSRFACTVCGESLSSAKNLKRHMNIHTRAEVFTCTVCSRSFIRKDYMVMHMKVHYGKKPHRCILCNKGFTSKMALESHKAMCRLVDRSRENHTCETCGEVFSSVRNLKRHINKHTLEDVYTCPICSRPFLRQDYLQHHMRKKHNGAKYHPYQCTFCYKLFHSNIKLQEHLQTHTGNKSFSCTICHESFGNILALKVHMRIHLQEKSTKDMVIRKCDICDVSFPGLISLNKHKLYQHNFCSTCEQVFPDRAALEAHKLQHEKEANPYKCDICQRTFTERDKYNNHICAASAMLSSENAFAALASAEEDNDVSIISESSKQEVAVVCRSTSPEDLAKMSLAFWQSMNNEENSIGNSVGSEDQAHGKIGNSTAGLPLLVESVAGNVSLVDDISVSSASPCTALFDSESKSMSHPTLVNCLSGRKVTTSEEHQLQKFQPRANPRKSSTPKRSDALVPKPDMSGTCLSDVSISCEQMATSSQQLVNQKVVNMSELSECANCGIYFSDRTMYIMHMGLHVPDNPWQCNLCGVACHDRYSFAVHVMKTQH